MADLAAPVVGAVVGWAWYDQKTKGETMLGVDWKTVIAVLIILAILGFIAPQLRKTVTGAS